MLLTLRLFEYTYHYIKTVDTTGETRKWHKKTARDREKEAAILQLIESFFESTPQLALKMYLALLSPQSLTIWKGL